MLLLIKNENGPHKIGARSRREKKKRKEKINIDPLIDYLCVP